MSSNNFKSYLKRKREKEIEEYFKEYKQIKQNYNDSSEYSDDKYSGDGNSDNEYFDTNDNVQYYDVKSSESESEVDEESSDGLVEEEPEIPQISNWIVDCNIAHNHANQLLKILRKRVLPGLPATTTTLLQNRIDIRIQDIATSSGINGQYTYLGIKKGLEKIKLMPNQSNLIELIVNIDGFPPFKSSPLQIWPILCKIYSPNDEYMPFTVAVYAGSGKPANVKEYLKDFVQELLNEKVRY